MTRPTTKPVTRRRREAARRLGLAALLAYSALLVLAALPPEVRPHALDVPGEASRALLARLGIRPGVSVFESSREPVRRIVRNDCIRVRGFRADDSHALLAPPEGACFTQGLRVRLPWREFLLRSLLLRPPPPLDASLMGDWFCHGPAYRSQEFERIEILWSQPWLDLRTGDEGLNHAALLVWSCRASELEQRSLRPGPEELHGLPPGPLPETG